jgi:FixJ family two-component response regulator
VSSSVRAMKGGAVDFLEKPVSDDALIGAVARALQRNREMQAEHQEIAILQTRHARLTPREKQVFALVTSGLLNKQVGYELNATEKTIKVHRARVMEKMEAPSLADLVRMASRLGVKPPTPPA